MYLSASRQFDTVVVWEQRTPDGRHRVRKYPSIYQCYIKVLDWRTIVANFKCSVEEGSPDTVLADFVGACKDTIDRTVRYTSMYGDELYKIVFHSGRDWKYFLGKVPVEISLWESDIPPELKVLSANYYKATLPSVNVSFYDIEVDYQPRKHEDSQIIRTLHDGVERAITCAELRTMRSYTDFQVYDDDTKQWAHPETTNYLYCGEIGFSSTANPYAPVNAIAFFHVWKDEYVVFAVPPKTWRGLDPNDHFDWSLFKDVKSKCRVQFCQSEAELLALSVEEFQQCDLMSGYNSSLFDDPYIAQRIEMVLGGEWLQMMSFPNGRKPYYQEVEIMFRKQKKVVFDGRISLDYLELFKKFTVEDRDSWNLESVSADHLGERFKKLDYEGTLNHLYNHNFTKFVRYNLRDTEILNELDKKYKFLNTANSLVHQSTCHFKNIVGTVRTADMAIVNDCWYERGQQVPDSKILDEQGKAAGAYVLVPQTGMKSWIACFDIKSLYPNTIRTLNISPETLRGQFIEFEAAWTAIYNESSQPLTMRWEHVNEPDTRPAYEWREILIEKKCAVSGYGTVFDQTFEGIIPALLGNWYNERTKHQGLAKQLTRQISDLQKHAKEMQQIGQNEQYVELEQQIAKLDTEFQYHDMLQYCLKIKLNSLYGALLNQSFRFYDKRLGQSTTASGRNILRHQLKKGCEIIDGDYSIEPIVDDEDPRAIRGEVASPSLAYGDTDSVTGDTLIYVNGEKQSIATFYDTQPDTFLMYNKTNANYVKQVVGCTSIGHDGTTTVTRLILHVMKHTVHKQMYEVTVNKNVVIITADHSIMVRRGDQLIGTKPTGIASGDRLLCKSVSNGCVETESFVLTDLGVQELDVYDIEVEDVHNFFANDILVHNSGYFTLDKILPPSPTVEFVVRIADQIGEEINVSFPEFNRKAFLCQPGFDVYITTGRELVADKGFYIQKKRYVIHVVDKEGKRKDELKAMGVDMRKTTTPRHIKAFLRKTCYDLLTGRPDLEIDNYIMEFRDTTIDVTPLVEVGFPKGIKKVELYTEAFNGNPRTRLPGHVAASILYNDYRMLNNDVISLPITSGMKIRIFNFDTDFFHQGRMFNSIAIPTDAEEVPDWFLDEFAPRIDRIKHANKLVDNMLHNMFDSILRPVPTRHMQALEQDFDWS